ncbi:hypothetical protein DSO57_1003333 [Entomophthora muscae]|uniref:Uncharacterized protein n=1 Tax=Entomophthora muscae TaxID=34485 RepID=A0ACC2U819_9FUNG|nr:hypothetical protein DSO57_1003333 [Entomophthora muscae]
MAPCPKSSNASTYAWLPDKKYDLICQRFVNCFEDQWIGGKGDVRDDKADNKIFWNLYHAVLEEGLMMISVLGRWYIKFANSTRGNKPSFDRYFEAM